MNPTEDTKHSPDSGNAPPTWEQLNEKLLYIEKQLQEVRRATQRLIVFGVHPECVDDELVKAQQVRNTVQTCREEATNIVMDSTAAIANVDFRRVALSRKDAENYEEKKRLAKWVNEVLRDQGAVIAHPKTKEPCLLLAVTSHEGHGRYTLENRIGKKRHGSYKTLIDLLPIIPIPDVPRKEGVLTRREKSVEPQAAQTPLNWTERIDHESEERGGRS